MKTVHYIFDPMCGWCYGASPLIESLNAMPELHLSLHPGGMLTRQTIAEPFRQHILNADERIAQITGQHFGKRIVKGYIIMSHSLWTLMSPRKRYWLPIPINIWVLTC
ncbi:hypothetical protein [Vibrio cincinnatiensis]|uniref:hypothetical protein n=1 Tax=Vibrio cincinnatiensis TaxID=675 RepID=UPI001EE11E59|nr:hypothetical protein [Vibrio cincinnatiensis]